MIDALDQRNNLIFGIFANGFLLWDLKQSYRLEKWITRHHAAVENWFEAVERTDAYNSLGNFAFNHPSYIFPKILAEKQGTHAVNLGHPLLDPEKRVTNNFDISGEEFFRANGLVCAICSFENFIQNDEIILLLNLIYDIF